MKTRRGRSGGGVGVKSVAKRQEQRVMRVDWRVAIRIGEGITYFEGEGRVKGEDWV